MATPRVTIPDLPAHATPIDSDLLVIQSGTATKKMTVGALNTQATTALNAHLANPTDAHDASAVSATANTAPMTGTNVQLQLAQAGTEIATVKTTANGASTGLAAHLADTIDAHDASAISFVPTGTVAATEVQAAIVEVASEAATNLTTVFTSLDNHLVDTSDAHDASAISCLPAGNLVSTNVQAALTELQVSIDDVTTTGIAGKVDKTTTITTVAPLIGGGDLSTSRSLGIDVFTPTVKGAVPPPTTVTGAYLKDDGTWTIPASGGGGITTEDAVDATAAAFAAGTHTNITVTYNDAANSISLAASGGGGGTAAATTYAGSTNLVATNVEAALDELDAEKQPASAVLTDLATRWTVASSAGPAALAFYEDTDTGANKATIQCGNPAADITLTLPTNTTTLVGASTVQALTQKTIDGASNTLTNIPTSALVRAIVTQSGTAVTGALTDAWGYLRFTGTNPTYTVPPNSTVAFGVGTQIDGISVATAMTLIAGAGVTITRARTLVTVGAGSGWTLIKTGTDTFDLHGDFV